MTAPKTPSRPGARPRIALVLMAACGWAALAWTGYGPRSIHLVYNPSDSMPTGWYRVDPPVSLHAGSIVLTRLPAAAAEVAVQRRYLPAHIPLLKTVGAVAPQHVCIKDGVVRIDGSAVAALLHADRWGRPLPAWTQCRLLADGELFLLSTTNPASFDSRYFGPIAAASVIGVAQPLHVERQP